MITFVVVLGVLTILVVLVHEILVSIGEYRRARVARHLIALDQLRAERHMAQLTQVAVAQMLEAARRR